MQIHELRTCCVYIGLSDIGILCSQNILAFIGVVDSNILLIAELDCHHLRNGRDNKHLSRVLYNWCVRSIMLMKKVLYSALCKQLWLLQLEQAVSEMGC